MERKVLRRIVPLAFSVALLVGGPVLPVGPAMAGAQAAAQQANVLKGKVVGLSKKARTISIEVGSGKDAKTMMVKFNDQTKGIEHASKGHAAIIEFSGEGGDKIATVIKPKLAKLPKGTVEMQPEELSALIAKGDPASYFLVDSRPAARFAEGSIPTAVSIPVPVMQKEGAKLLPADKNKLLVFFCGGVTCGMSTKDAGMAVKLGYTNVHVMLKGVPGWKKAGHAVVASEKFVQEGNIVLLDLRDRQAYEAGHMARAHNIPLAQLATSDDLLPASPAAPIVVYGDQGQAEAGYKALAKMKRKKIALAPQDFAAWQAAGNPVATGPTPAEIRWVRKLGKDEVSIKDFLQVAKAHPADKLILDVRTDAEAAEGHFAGSVHIPLDQLAAKMATLPQDKEILVHCTTGARAEMASTELRNGGFKSRFLVANVECEGAECEVGE